VFLKKLLLFIAKSLRQCPSENINNRSLQ
jgi:hypothetical protein